MSWGIVDSAPTMRALIYDGTAARLDSAHPNPEPGPGEAVVRTLLAAVSPYDIEITRGVWPFKGVLGQQFVGEIEHINKPATETGRGAESSLSIGSRVVGSIITSCNRCDLCVRGLRSHCRSKSIMGMLNRDGCLADRFSLPASNLRQVPDSIDNDHAVFSFEVSMAVQALQQLTIQNKPYITVLGDNSLALITAQVMARLNASVRMVGSEMHRLELCDKWGLKHRHISDVGRRADQDVVIDCTGSSSGLNVSMQMVRPRGKIVVKSMPGLGKSPPGRDDQPIDLRPLVMNEIELIGSFCGPMGEALTKLKHREIDVVSLISRRMHLSDGPAILRAAADPKITKLLVEM